MSQPAARLTDLHLCPMQTPAVVPIPHVGGPIVTTGAPTILIGGLPAATVGDICICVGPPAPIALGSFTVLFAGKPAARVGDMTGHGGAIMPPGCPTVLIGDSGGGAGSAPAFTMSQARATGAAFTRTNCAAKGAVEAAAASPFAVTATPDEKHFIEIELVDQHGKPVPHERFRIVPPNGAKPIEGFLDEKGFARINGLDPGTCTIGFPNLDAASWKPEKGDPGRLQRPIPAPEIVPSIGPVTLSRRPGVGVPSIGPVTLSAASGLSFPAIGPVQLQVITGVRVPVIGPVQFRILKGNLPGVRLKTIQLRVLRAGRPAVQPASVVLRVIKLKAPVVKPETVTLRVITLKAPTVKLATITLRPLRGKAPSVRLNSITVRPISKR